MEDLESKLLENLGDIDLLKQLSDRLSEESVTKRMKTTESLSKVLEEYKLAGVLKLQNTVTEFLWKIFRQASECALSGVNSSEEKFQAAWSLILLKLVKLQLEEEEEPHENTYFIKMVSHLYANRSFKVLGYLIREYQDIAISIIKTLVLIVQQAAATTDCTLIALKALPPADKVKVQVFIRENIEDLPKKRKRIENFDPEISKQKVLVDTQHWAYQYHENIGKLWIAVLSSTLHDSDIKTYLKAIPKFGFAQVAEPLLFSDFFLKSYDMGGSLAVLALNGLFILSTQYNLESKLYYTKLYVLLRRRMEEGKNMKPGFLRLVELSLSSHLLASTLVASFVKLFMKETLRTTRNQAMWNVAFALKCLKTHPALVKMLHNENTEEVYISTENDPMLAHATDSSLWELMLLKKHYNSSLVDLIKEFEKPIEKIPRITPGELFSRPEVPAKSVAKDYRKINISR